MSLLHLLSLLQYALIGGIVVVADDMLMMFLGHGESHYFTLKKIIIKCKRFDGAMAPKNCVTIFEVST